MNTGADIIDIHTPKKYLLNGLWIGPKNPRKAIIWVHGLGSSMFSKLEIMENLIDENTAVLTFNNRGHDTVSYLRHTNRKRGKVAGAAHEVFEECVDDIQGAIDYAKSRDVQEVYLAGHSTGCQKSVYWAHKKALKEDRVKGLVLLAPVSDYAGALRDDADNELMNTTKLALMMDREGRGHTLLPETSSRPPIDAQRFLSLYTSGSTEEIFSYVDPDKKPRILQSVQIPILVILADKDEFADRNAKELAEWFDTSIKASHHVEVVPGDHGFHGSEDKLSQKILKWIG